MVMKKTKRYGDWISPSIIKYKLNSKSNDVEDVIFTVKPAKKNLVKMTRRKKQIV